jgi:hypothetical protein
LLNIYSLKKQLTMAVRHLAFTLLLTMTAVALQAQSSGAPVRSFTPSDSWEIGLDLGLPSVVGDIDSKFPGFGAGLHARKALDHVFSLRFGAVYAQMKNEDDGTNPKSSETSSFSGSGQVVVTLNNLRFNKPVRKVLFNVYAGLGA